MLHAAAMVLALWALWALFVDTGGAAPDLAIGFLAALASVFLAARFGGIAAFWRAPMTSLLLVRRAPSIFRGALSTLRLAVAADVTLKPALVRIKPRISGAEARAAFSGLMSAAPGALVVEADADGLLAHVLDEDKVDAYEITALENGLLRVFSAGARA